MTTVEVILQLSTNDPYVVLQHGYVHEVFVPSYAVGFI